MTDQQKREAFRGAFFLASLAAIGGFSFFWGVTGNALASMGVGITLFVVIRVYLFGAALGEG